MTGVVSNVAFDHVGVIVHGIFNASFPCANTSGYEIGKRVCFCLVLLLLLLLVLIVAVFVLFFVFVFGVNVAFDHVGGVIVHGIYQI